MTQQSMPALSDAQSKVIHDAVLEIERFQAAQADAILQVSAIYRTLKQRGFDTVQIRKLVTRRSKAREKVNAEDALLATYEAAMEAAS